MLKLSLYIIFSFPTPYTLDFYTAIDDIEMNIFCVSDNFL